jgi:hypothetical protein
MFVQKNIKMKPCGVLFLRVYYKEHDGAVEF